MRLNLMNGQELLITYCSGFSISLDIEPSSQCTSRGHARIEQEKAHRIKSRGDEGREVSASPASTTEGGNLSLPRHPVSCGQDFRRVMHGSAGLCMGSAGQIHDNAGTLLGNAG